MHLIRYNLRHKHYNYYMFHHKTAIFRELQNKEYKPNTLIYVLHCQCGNFWSVKTVKYIISYV